MNLRIYYQNCRGLRTKTSTFYINILSENYDLIMLTETWLTEDISDSEIFDPRYVVFRKDRDIEVTGKKRGGGVLIAVQKKYKAFLIDIPTYLETVFVEVSIHGKPIIFNCTYIPPQSNLQCFKDYVDIFTNIDHRISLNTKIILFGDFNLPCVNGARFIFDNNSKITACMHELINIYNLESFNNCLNEDFRTLDLIFGNIDIRVSDDCLPAVPVDKKHPPLIADFEIKGEYMINNSSNNLENKYNFKIANFTLLYEMLRDCNWDTLTSFMNVDDAVDYFYLKFYEILDICVPKYNNSPNRNKKTFSPWFTQEIKQVLKQKEYFRKRKSESLFNLNKYKELRATLKSKIQHAYTEYVKDIENNISTDPNIFWNFVNAKQQKRASDSQFLINDEHTTDKKVIAEGFAEYFSSVFDQDQSTYDINIIKNIAGNLHNNQNYLHISKISIKDLENAFKKLKPKRSAGPDGIPCYIFKACKEILIYPLLIIFQKSLELGVFPKKFKSTRVTPIHKKDDKTIVNNYRPISLLNCIAKLYEFVLYDKIYEHVKNIISPKQHGFFRHRSIETNLATYVNKIQLAFEAGEQVDTIYTDFAKAFDKVNHDILLSKLLLFGLSDHLVNIISSYLINRMQFISYYGTNSKPFLATSGVPQGSNLGPLLFLIFVNDLPQKISTDCLLYADDLKLFKQIDNINDSLQLQKDIDIICDWSVQNKLPFNVNKCSIMTYSRAKNPKLHVYTMKGSILKRNKEIKDLGILFQPDLSFKNHVDCITSRSYKLLGFIKRATYDFKNIQVIKNLYNSLLRSHLEFGSAIWNPSIKNLKQIIETIQNKFIKYIYYKKHNKSPGFVHYEPFRREFDIPKLEHRRIQRSLIFLYKILNGDLDSAYLLSQVSLYIPDHRVRPKQITFYVNKTNGIINNVCAMFNVFNDIIPLDIFGSSLNKFRNAISKIPPFIFE